MVINTIYDQATGHVGWPPDTGHGRAVACAVLMPHAPILVPAVGGERGGAAKASRRAMREAAACVLNSRPEALVVISPHTPRKARAFGLWADDRIQGSFEQFNAPEAQVSLPSDRRFANSIVAEAQARSLETWLIQSHSLDHGALVPLWFLAEAGWTGPTVLLSLNYLEEGGLANLGEAIAAAASARHRRIAIIASGDMSHRLTADAPCGFHPQAHLFDETFIHLLRVGNYDGIQNIDRDLRELAAEDAVDSTLIAMSAVGWDATGHKVLNYERPFGVGYGVAILYAESPKQARFEAIPEIAANREGIVLPRHARRSVEMALCGSPELPPAPTGKYLASQHGVFVTVRQQNGNLRGCVGTIVPVCANLVAETWRNARLATLQDARFPPVTADELAGLRFHVSVIHSLKEVSSPGELCPRRYGVIVSTDDDRRGVLLPGIREITHGEQQLALARRKGWINPDERVKVQRFEIDHFEEPAGQPDS